jgi:hypothetical protein
VVRYESNTGNSLTLDHFHLDPTLPDDICAHSPGVGRSPVQAITAMTKLRLLLLGSPRLEKDDILLKLSRRKALALLAYLAVTEGNLCLGRRPRLER